MANKSWKYIDCDCYEGLQYCGGRIIVCSECKGAGHYHRHIKSGARAKYPGGPFIGSEPKEHHTQAERVEELQEVQEIDGEYQ